MTRRHFPNTTFWCIYITPPAAAAARASFDDEAQSLPTAFATSVLFERPWLLRDVARTICTITSGTGSCVLDFIHSHSTNTFLAIGLMNGTSPRVRRFLGIPFAQPPVGDRRQLAPATSNPNAADRFTDMPKLTRPFPQYESDICVQHPLA
ncbi:hypothetical protein DFH05DRAFT_1523854 [Lentinula detonsa]|uniref:Uncharacterized protein n=1 Tax=Lentinula detonsa TaxID=2804962 RepID=A0A9W8P2H0_9AGAR|nr:hypothetical protein DFH05DRAFT_1523854 [Lentinula detonsa]